MHGNYSASGTGDLIHHLQHHLWENVPLVSMLLCPSVRPGLQLPPAPAECLLGSRAGLGPQESGLPQQPQHPKAGRHLGSCQPGGWGWGWGKREAMPVVKGLLAEVWRMGKREGCG